LPRTIHDLCLRVQWDTKQAGIDIISTNDDDAVNRGNQFSPQICVSGKNDGEAAGGYDGINISSAHLMARSALLVTGNVRGNANPWSWGMCHV
jgi:hypothetical protein